MIINKKTGAIAYHALRLQETRGIELVQYDYDGKILERELDDEEILLPTSQQDLWRN